MRVVLEYPVPMAVAMFIILYTFFNWREVTMVKMVVGSFDQSGLVGVGLGQVRPVHKRLL